MSLEFPPAFITRKYLVDGSNHRLCRTRFSRPLFIAAGEGTVSTVRCLLDHGANPNLTNNYGKSPLAEANRNEYEQVSAMLTDAGADEARCRRAPAATKYQSACGPSTQEAFISQVSGFVDSVNEFVNPDDESSDS